MNLQVMMTKFYILLILSLFGLLSTSCRREIARRETEQILQGQSPELISSIGVRCGGRSAVIRGPDAVSDLVRCFSDRVGPASSDHRCDVMITFVSGKRISMIWYLSDDGSTLTLVHPYLSSVGDSVIYYVSLQGLKVDETRLMIKSLLSK